MTETQGKAPTGDDSVTHGRAENDIIEGLDDATAELVRLAARLTVAEEPEVRAALEASIDIVPPIWVEELILQCYLFAGFPRALNAMREWRRLSNRQAPTADESDQPAQATEWTERGEATCAAVYGPFYQKLRVNIRHLHPALDGWMVTEGYGKVLSRPGLDLVRRELCIIAACVAAAQHRQLHSHLHGAVHVGGTVAEVSSTLDALTGIVPEASLRSARMLWARVQGK